MWSYVGSLNRVIRVPRREANSTHSARCLALAPPFERLALVPDSSVLPDTDVVIIGTRTTAIPLSA